MSTASTETISPPPSGVDVSRDPEALKSEPQLNEKSQDDPFKVVMLPEDDPKNLGTTRKWTAVLIISLGAMCVTCASSVAGFTEQAIAKEFNITSPTVPILALSIYVLGLAIGPLLIGPLSELYGRKIIYQVSFSFFFAFSFPVAFAPNISVFLVFRFLTGFCSAAFFSVAGGSVSDLFHNHQVGAPMAMYTLSPFVGPVLGPVISGFINQNTYWRWTYRLLIIWSFFELVGLWLIVPETFEPLILARQAQKLRKETGDDRYWAPLEKSSQGPGRNIINAASKSFEIIIFEPMAMLLDIWTALILGILYLTFQAFPIIFGRVHGFNVQMTGLSFVGMGIGMVFALCTQPLWDRLNARMMVKHNGSPPPETRLIIGMWGAVLIPVGIFWIAFTTYPSVHWIVPIIGSIPFGTGVCYAFTAVFTYLVVAYRPVAASAMAGNTFMRCTFAFAFPLFAGYMYDTLGTVGATALLGGLMTLLAPLPFIFYRIGARLRKGSRFAVQ